MIRRQTKHLLLKIVSMLSVVRGYNVAIIVLAQYISAIFILAPEKKRALDIILDFNLFMIVLVSSLTIASGYIINNFYDSKKDLINRPNKSQLDRLVSQKTKLRVYFTVNFIVFFLSFFVSFRAVLFFSAYIFLIWFYSHKLKKILVVGNLTAAFLAVLPFFAILLYYKTFYPQIFSHATFLFLLLLIREMIKDLENIKGDIANGYQTIPAVYGEQFSKKIITLLTLSTVVPVYFLVEVFEVGYMDIYFYVSLIILIFFLQKLWKSNSKPDYLKLHNILKFLVVSGVFCIILINPEVLVHGKRLLRF
ncbi:geranylgeranylglycerol-phosphate geranylgeranyltransferase [Flavobacterium sp.]|uniref:geranylgeranylglycerol-phosphate geranylgeranyltransferase n=1 Tax=Flavobacterium sp. TaxID=239 RepID=UPI0025EAB247|nr:geranylgeranylglycerol-phosphate geranylgeranyltransferase [Flavobacterium sp.]